MTSSTIFLQLTEIQFVLKRLPLSAKSEGSGWRRQRGGRVVCFPQNKGETKKSIINDVN